MLKGKDFFCSWSGGKDSCLSLYRAVNEGGIPRLLFTMFAQDGERSGSHGLPRHVLQAQADSLGIPIKTGSASWSDYEGVFLNALKDIKGEGIDMGVFGDIDIAEHKAWAERICSQAAMDSYHPLWKKERTEVLKEFIDSGFKAVIVALKDGIMDKDFLGKTLDSKLVEEIQGIGIDPCGEAGEFHTVVVDGPIFKYPVDIKGKDRILREGYWFLDITA